MFGMTRWTPFDEMLNVHREVDRLFNQVWTDLATRATHPGASSSSFQVRATEDAWILSVPMPGVDPKHVNLEVAGNTLTIRADQPESKDAPSTRFEQTVTVPQFVNIDQVGATHRHGLLELTLPFKDSVKPRRIAISTSSEEPKQLAASA
jgi:HSP20 family protein